MMSRKVGLFVVFVVATCLSFFTTKLIVNDKYASDSNDNSDPVIVANTRTITDASTGSNAGTSTGSNAGTSTGSNSGTSAGSNAGTSTGSNSGTSAGSNTVTSNSSNAGTSASSNAGSSNKSNAGTSAGSNTVTSNSSNAGTSASSNAGSSNKSNVGSSTGANAETPPIAKQIILMASTPVGNGQVYSFTASFRGEVTEPYSYQLWNDSRLVSKSNDGRFNDIPGIKGGAYKLCLVSEATGKNIAKPIVVRGFVMPKMLITKEEFQRRMLDNSDHTLDGGRKSVVAKSFRVVVINAKSEDGDFHVSDIQDVRDMIRTYNKWTSARVVVLEYDANGYVTLANIEAIY